MESLIELKRQYDSQIFQGINTKDVKHLKTKLVENVGHSLVHKLTLEQLLNFPNEQLENECKRFLHEYALDYGKWRHFERPIESLLPDCCVYLDFILPRIYLKFVNRYDVGPSNIHKLLQGYCFKYSLNKMYSERLAKMAEGKPIKTYDGYDVCK